MLELTERLYGPHSAYTVVQQSRKPFKIKPDVAQLCLPDCTPSRGVASESASIYGHYDHPDVSDNRHVLAAQNLSNFQRTSATRSSQLRDTATLAIAISAISIAARTFGLRFEGYSGSVSLDWQNRLFACQAMLTDPVQHVRRRTVSSRLVLLAVLLRYRRHEDDTFESCDTTDRLS